MGSSKFIILEIKLATKDPATEEFSESQISVFEDLGIETKSYDWHTLLIKGSRIDAMYEHDGSTWIYIGSETYRVKDTMLEILKKIDGTRDRKIRSAKFRRKANSISSEFKRYSKKERNRVR